MTEILLDIAEELFIDNKIVEAYNTAKTAQKLDPFFGSVDRYVAAYRVHAAALRKNHLGEIDWYNVLGVDYSVPIQTLTHRFCRMGKLIHPDDHCSAAAQGAYELAAKAFEVLGQPETRASFHKRRNLPPVDPQTGLIIEIQESPLVVPPHIPASPLEKEGQRRKRPHSALSVPTIQDRAMRVATTIRPCASSRLQREGHTRPLGFSMPRMIS